jgi:hypothetical protein
MELAAYDNPFRDHLVRDRLAIAARLLSAPAECSVDVLQRASLAVQNILEAVYGSAGIDLAAAVPDAARETAAHLRKSVPLVAEAADGKIPAERIYFLLGAAGGLLTNQDDPYLDDRIDYAALIAAELALVHHSRSISERGFPMLRAARINSAWAEPRDPSRSLH